MTFTCGQVKSSQTYKDKSSFSMKISSGKVNYLKVEISKGELKTKKDILATVRISIEELVEKSANINQ